MLMTSWTASEGLFELTRRPPYMLGGMMSCSATTLECLIDETMVISETMSYFAQNAKRDDGNKRDNGILWKYLEVRRWENLSETMVNFEKLIKWVV